MNTFQNKVPVPETSNENIYLQFLKTIVIKLFYRNIKNVTLNAPSGYKCKVKV